MSGSIILRAHEKAAGQSARAGPITVIVVGRSGAGKSSTVNTLLRESRAKVSPHLVGTTSVSDPPYLGSFHGLPVAVYDTPGFGDALDKDGNDAQYVDQMRTALERPDVILFISSLTQMRVDDIDEDSLRLVVDHFTAHHLSKSMVFGFTHADECGGDLPSQLNMWAAELYRRFSKIAGVDLITAASIPSVAIANVTDKVERAKVADQVWLYILGRCERVPSRVLLMFGGSATDDPS